MPEPLAPGHGARIAVAGVDFLADPAGGLYWPAERVLVVADMHLEKGAAYAARGLPLPPYDTPDTLALVARLMRRYRPRTVVSLGDGFHRADSHRAMPGELRARLAALTGACRWVWVAGNHDPAAPDGLGGEWAEAFTLGPVTFRHEPRAGASGEIAGHLHPVARIRSRGRLIRRRSFAVNAERVVMPAVGAYAGGLNVLDPAFAFIFPSGRFHAWMLGSRRLYPMVSSRLVADPGIPAARRAG